MQRISRFFSLSVVSAMGVLYSASLMALQYREEIVIEKNAETFAEGDVVVIKLTKSGVFVNENPVTTGSFKTNAVSVSIVSNMSPQRHRGFQDALASRDKKSMYSIEVPEAEKPCLGIIADATEQQDGVITRIVLPKSAAEKAGIKREDKIVKINGYDIHTGKDLLEVIMSLKEKDTAVISYIRAGVGKRNAVAVIENWNHQWGQGDSAITRMIKQKMKTHFANSGMNRAVKKKNTPPKLGVEVEEVRKKNSDFVSGFKVVSVSPDSYAQECGVKVGDVIIQIGDKKISGKTFPEALEEWQAIQKSLESSISLEILRGRKSKQILVSFHPKRVSI